MVDGHAAGRLGGWAVRQLAGSDCERVGGGVLAQPVNAVSSLSFVAVGIAIAVASRRHEGPPAAALVYSGLLVAIGVGSVVYHGPQTAGARVLHDVPILLTVLFVVARDVGLLMRPAGTRRAESLMAVVAIVVAILVVIVAPAVVGPLTGALVGSAVLAELLVARRGLRPSRRPGLVVAIVLVGVLSVIAWVLGRSDSGVCDPESALQFHAVWHATSATVLGLWWIIASPIRPPTGDLGPDDGGFRDDSARDR